jgi:hypothetical protein
VEYDVQTTENFEKMWPSDSSCACGQSDQARVLIIEKMMELGVELHSRLTAENICPIMMPHALGILNSIVLGLQQKIENPAQQVHMLTYPNVGLGVNVAHETANYLLADAIDSEGKRA